MRCRVATRTAAGALEHIHDLARDYVKFLHPVRKLVSKTREDAPETTPMHNAGPLLLVGASRRVARLRGSSYTRSNPLHLPAPWRRCTPGHAGCFLPGLSHGPPGGLVGLHPEIGDVIGAAELQRERSGRLPRTPAEVGNAVLGVDLDALRGSDIRNCARIARYAHMVGIHTVEHGDG